MSRCSSFDGATGYSPVARRAGRKPGLAEATKKKDFRMPVSLLAALKAVADEEDSSAAEIVLDLLRQDERIRRKLAEEMEA